MSYKEAMQARFHALGEEREPLAQKIEELKSKRDALLAEYEPKVKELEAQIHALQADGKLFEIDQERAALARALNGKTGPKPGDEPATEPEAAETPAAA